MQELEMKIDTEDNILVGSCYWCHSEVTACLDEDECICTECGAEYKPIEHSN